MNHNKTKFSVHVLDAEKKGVKNATVIIRSRKDEFHLSCENKQGLYTAERPIPKGRYEIKVSKKPFEDQVRNVEYDNYDLTALFILFKKETPFYYRGKVKVPFTPLENKIALFPVKRTVGAKGKKGEYLSVENRKKVALALAKENNLKVEKSNPNFEENGVVFCSFPSKSLKKEKQEICLKLEIGNKIKALPILEINKNEASFITNVAMVKFEDFIERKEVDKIAKENGFKVKRKVSVLGNFFHFITDEPASYQILTKINKLAENENVIFAEPSLAFVGQEEDAITPTDFLFPEQWDHQIINTQDAWQFLSNTNASRTFGSPNVIIAVVDSGVDPTHPDFAGNVSNGSSKIYTAFDFANMVANNTELSSGHGTSCASAASSRTNNVSAIAGTNEGVSGVAGNCRIMGVRRDWPSSEADYADMYLWVAGFDPDSDDDDFPAQINPGADVISSSIGHPGTGSVISGTMTAVFDKLTDDGRDGKGTLLYFSAANNSNDNDTVFDRPWGLYNRCFSIAASTLNNTGTAEVQANYSNFSSQTEVCAPSQDTFVGSGALHNPPANYGTFTATPLGAPEGHGTVGRPTATTTMSSNSNAGTNTVTVNSVAGFSNGMAIFFGNPGGGNTEAHIISNVNNGTNTISLNRNLFNNQNTGTAVIGATWDYRSNFGGTSHSTPICAGVAALMISANPDLSWTQVRDIIRDTAVKINPGETNANGRWQDVNGNLSNSVAYNGIPLFSKFYGFGRINAAAAVREAGWDIELVTSALDFNDVPEGDTVSRAIRFNVKSRWATTFNLTPPGSPFNALTTSESLGTATNSLVTREVYFWVTFTGGTAGDTVTMADGVTATVQNPQTEQEWVIPVTANVIEKETSAIILCLDQSGSMDFPSGIGTSKRIDILRFSANIMIDVLHENNGLGIVSFDHNPHNVLDFIGPVGPPTSPSNPFDQDRTDMKSAINLFTPNPAGNTAIGDGIEIATSKLNAVTGYDSKSIIVFTDGKETASKRINEVTDLINTRIFGVGLGKGANIEPDALNEITNSNEGYMLLADDLGQDSFFKLAKYFLQIQAGINNEEVIVDPDGTLYPNQVHKIPFVVTEADITLDVIAMIPNPSYVKFLLETPNGQIIDPSLEGSIPGVTYGIGNNVVYYRLNLPVPLGVDEKEGTWNAVLAANDGNRYYAYNEAVHSSYNKKSRKREGIPYSLLVHSYSNLKMETSITQSHYEPGAELLINVSLSQFGIPLTKPCEVQALTTLPNNQKKTIKLIHQGNGIYEARMTADYPGTYQFLIKAAGYSLKEKPFTREQVRSATVWKGANLPKPGDPSGDQDREKWCRLIACLLNDKSISNEFKARLKKQGINIEHILKCLRAYCKDDPRTKKAASEFIKLKSALMSVLENNEFAVDLDDN